MNQPNSKKTKPIEGAFVVASVSSLAFFFVSPWILFVFAIMPIPVVTDIVVLLVDIPTSVLGLEVPKQDSFGYKGNVAKWFWSPILFAIIFWFSFKRRQKALLTKEKTEPPVGC